MGHGRTLFLILLASVLSGCTTDQPARSSSLLHRLRSWRGPAGSDVVQVDVALIERPYGDPFLSEELWTFADEQILPLERKAILEDAGFRIGQIGGIKPAGLQKLLVSDRSCLSRKAMFQRAGHAIPLELGPALPVCRVRQASSIEGEAEYFDQAECRLKVVPTLTKEGITRLEFMPEVRHGEPIVTPKPAEDGSGLLFHRERPIRTFTMLSWDLVLAPNQYLIIGGRPDRPESLGSQFFLRRSEPVPVQRLLVIRTYRSRSIQEGETADPFEEETKPSGTPPLALQAAMTK